LCANAEHRPRPMDSTLRGMTDERKGGIALIGAVLATMAVMALHPSGHDLLAPGRLEQAAWLNAALHGLAIAALPVLFLGALELTRRLDGPDRLAIAALVAYGLASVAGMAAASVSGFLATAVARRLAEAAPEQRQVWAVLFRYTGELNQAFAKVLTVSSAAAILLWSAALLRRTLARGVAVYGIAVSAITVVGVASGHLRLGVHGYGLVVLTQAAWFIAVGLMLWRAPTGGRAPS